MIKHRIASITTKSKQGFINIIRDLRVRDLFCGREGRREAENKKVSRY